MSYTFFREVRSTPPVVTGLDTWVTRPAAKTRAVEMELKLRAPTPAPAPGI